MLNGNAEHQCLYGLASLHGVAVTNIAHVLLKNVACANRKHLEFIYLTPH